MIKKLRKLEDVLSEGWISDGPIGTGWRNEGLLINFKMMKFFGKSDEFQKARSSMKYQWQIYDLDEDRRWVFHNDWFETEYKIEPLKEDLFIF